MRARTRVEKRRKELKAESLKFGRLVDSTAKELMAVVEPQEARLKALIDEVKAQKAAEKAERERIERERVEDIMQRINAMASIPAMHQRAGSDEILAARESLERIEVNEDEFQEFTQKASETKSTSLDELNEMYAGALHDEKLAEEERIERERKEAEQKVEAERLAKERADLEAKQKAIDEENERKQAELEKQERAIQAERDHMEAEKRAEAERIERERREEEEAEAKAKAEQEARELAKRVRPDRDKLIQYLQAIDGIEFPEVSDEFAVPATQIATLIEGAITDARALLA